MMNYIKMLLLICFNIQAQDDLTFSHPGGIHDRPINLEILVQNKALDVFYTLDGTLPHLNATKYRKPIPLTSSFAPKEFDSSEWSSPERSGAGGKVEYVAHVVRAQGFKNRVAVTPIISRTFWIGKKFRDFLPLVSLSMEPKELFSFENGIYVKGKVFKDFSITQKRPENSRFGHSFPANFTARGKEWRRKATLEFYEDTFYYQQEVLAGIIGAVSSLYPKKSFFLRGKAALPSHFFIASSPQKKQSKIVLRNGGSTLDNNLTNDALAHLLLAPFIPNTLSGRPVELFLNGNYWGIYYLKERWTKTAIRERFKLESKDIILVEKHYVKKGSLKEQQEYQRFKTFVSTQDLSVSENFVKLQKIMNLSNYIDHFIAQIYLGNRDFPVSNSFEWCAVDQKERGRYIILPSDLDNTFDLNLPSFRLATTRAADFWDSSHDLKESQYLFWSNLLKSKFVRDIFIERFQLVINTIFNPIAAKERTRTFLEAVGKAIGRETDRWRLNRNGRYQQHIKEQVQFIKERPKLVLEELGREYVHKKLIKIHIESAIPLNNIVFINDYPIIGNMSQWDGYFFQGTKLVIEVRSPDVKIDLGNNQFQDKINLVLEEDQFLKIQPQSALKSHR